MSVACRPSAADLRSVAATFDAPIALIVGRETGGASSITELAEVEGERLAAVIAAATEDGRRWQA